VWDTNVLSLQKYKEWLQLEIADTDGSEEELSLSEEEFREEMRKDGFCREHHENEYYGESFSNNFPFQHMIIQLLQYIDYNPPVTQEWTGYVSVAHLLN